MADYWRYHDRPSSASVHPKRPRTDSEDLPPGNAYFPQEETRIDDRAGQLPWREPESLVVTSMSVYGSGNIPGPDIPGPQSFAGGQLGAMSTRLSSMNDLAMNVQGGRFVGGADASLLKPQPLNSGRMDYPYAQDAQTAGHGAVPSDATPTLYVEGIPADCSRREAAHIFRPFVGFKEVRLVRKDGKRPGGEQFVLCFVDFTDPKCASIALEALQGYKFDEMEPSSDMLRLQYSHSPGSRSSLRDGPRGSIRERESFPPSRSFRH